MQECKSNNKDNVSVDEIFLAVKQTKKWTAKGTVSNNLSRMSTGKVQNFKKYPTKECIGLILTTRGQLTLSRLILEIN